LIAAGKRGNIKIHLPAGEAALIYVLPAGTRIRRDGGKTKAGNVVISYQ